ncbi:MAG: hypothetical protein HOO86_02685 [Bacteroidales bacterium]|nr:hypothetical protein [Bacteroidales bacterium]
MKILTKGCISIILLLMGFVATSQEVKVEDQLSESRNKNIKHQLDFRFKGGSGEFEKIFFANVDYTPEARKACILGVAIMSFRVDCNNKMSDFRLKNPLGYGLNEQMGKFFAATEGKWNTCSDEKYTRFEIPILFTIEGVETGGRGYLVVEGKYPGFKCKGDAYFLEVFNEMKAKNKTKKALHALDELIKRDPYNTTYYDMKKEFLKGDAEETK